MDAPAHAHEKATFCWLLVCLAAAGMIHAGPTLAAFSDSYAGLAWAHAEILWTAALAGLGGLAASGVGIWSHTLRVILAR